MTHTAIDLSGVHVENWRTDVGAPPVILNPDATLHACIAWAWGELYEARRIALAGLTADKDQALGLMEAIGSRVNGAERVISLLGDLTRRDRRTVASWCDASRPAERA